MDKAAEQQEKIEQLERCYSRLFQTQDGIVVLQDMRENCYVDKSTANPNLTNMAESMLINEGCRRVFLHIVSRMNMSMTEFYLHKKEGAINV